MKRIFVYGTLKKNGSLHEYYLSDAKFIKIDHVNGDLYKLYSLPYLFFDKKSKNKVPGEVYDVNERVFNEMKAMEEFSGYETIDVTTVGGKKVKVFTADKGVLSTIFSGSLETKKIKSW